MTGGSSLLDRYLAAVGLVRSAPSMPLLEQLVRRHLERFSFASVGPQLGDQLPLDPESLFDRIVVRRRGGYCFEQNGLMFQILSELGFATTMVLARVLISGEEHPPLTHRFTMVDLDGRRYLVDVGFGATCPAAPVRFDPSGVDADSGGAGYDIDGSHRIVEVLPGEFHLQLAKDGEHVSLYRFDTVRYGPADAELGHFYSHRHPDAVFVNNLVVSRAIDAEVRSLRNLELRIFRGDVEEQVRVADAAHLRRLLAEMFDVDVDEAEADRLFASAVGR